MPGIRCGDCLWCGIDPVPALQIPWCHLLLLPIRGRISYRACCLLHIKFHPMPSSVPEYVVCCQMAEKARKESRNKKYGFLFYKKGASGVLVLAGGEDQEDGVRS